MPLRHNAAVRAALRVQVVRNIAKSLQIIDVVVESDAEIAEVEEKPILVTARRAVPFAVEKPHPEAMDVDPQAPFSPLRSHRVSTSRKRRSPHSASPSRVKKPKVSIDTSLANFPKPN